MTRKQNRNPITIIIKFLKNIDYEKISSNTGLFFECIKRQATKGGKESTRMMLELYYVLLSEKTSKFNKLLIGAAFAYQFLPNDLFTKENYGLLGYLDNIAILYLAYKRVKKSVTPEILNKVDETIISWEKSIDGFTILKPVEERL